MSEEKKIEESPKPPALPDDPVVQTASEKETQDIEIKTDSSAPETKLETSNQQPATANMEVHKHPHDVTHKKKWGEYLLEFLMIFFAVFLGFIAENMREKIVEESRAKEYAAALAHNLKGDITQFYWIHTFRLRKDALKDSLLRVLSKPPNPEYDSSLQRLISQGLLSRLYYVPIDATWQEVKSTGALRFMDRRVADSLVQYYTYISELVKSETNEETEIKNLTPTLYTFLNADYQYARRTNKPYSELKKIRRLKEDPEARNSLLNWVLHLRDVSETMEQYEERSSSQATNLVKLIEQEYHLKNE